VRAVFLAAVQAADPAQRSAILDRECGADTGLRQHVEALLRANREPDGDLSDPSDGTVVINDPTDQEPISQAMTRRAPDPAPAGSEEDEEKVLRGFLQPSTKPGSLGRLGHYEVLQVLGRGGFGIVVRAFDETLHRGVAIKVMSPQAAMTSSARKRFLREARAAPRVRQENVLQIYPVDESPAPYLAIECT